MTEEGRTPTSDLDLQMMLTDSQWGKTDVSKELRDRLQKQFARIGENGKAVITNQSLWDALNFYTRDLRLANLSELNNELYTCRYYLDLAADLLTVDMKEPFIVALSRAATILETSQSKRGFLRRLINTLRHENIHQELEPPKKKLLGGRSTMEA